MQAGAGRCWPPRCSAQPSALGRARNGFVGKRQPGKAGTDLRRAPASSPASAGAGQHGKGPLLPLRHLQAGEHIILMGCQHTGLGQRLCHPSRGCGLLGKGAHTPAFPVMAPGPSQRHPRLGTHCDTSKEANGARPFPGQRPSLPAPGSKRRVWAPLQRHQASSPQAHGTMEPGRAIEPELGPCSHVGGATMVREELVGGQGGGRMPGSPGRTPGSSSRSTRWQGWSATSRESRERDSRQAGSL